MNVAKKAEMVKNDLTEVRDLRFQKLQKIYVGTTKYILICV